MHTRMCRQAWPRLCRHGLTPRPALVFTRPLSSKQPPRDHRRQESSVAGPFSAEYENAPPEARPFAVERVGGRECHVSWSDSGSGIEKEWREIAAPEAGEGKVAVAGTNSVTGRVSAWFRQMFLPTNYPHSVHES